jgi:hypothetical protein
MNNEHAKLLAGVLSELGFKRSSDHESVKDLWFIDIKSGIELEVSYLSGKGRLFIYDAWNDRALCDIPVQFAGIGHLRHFIQSLQEPAHPIECYLEADTMADKDAFPEWAKMP